MQPKGAKGRQAFLDVKEALDHDSLISNLRLMRNHPKLLYLAYPFRPAPMIACVRTWNTAVHLTSLGWDVTVVTPEPSLWQKPGDAEHLEEDIARSGFKYLTTGHDFPMLLPYTIRWREGKLAWFAGGICRRMARRLRVEAEYGWYPAARRACANLSPTEVDLILATGGPYVSFEAARYLARKLAKPFVLDYRDPWSGSPHGKLHGRKSTEARLLRACAAVTVVSPSWADLIGATFHVAHKTHVVPNGYDERMFEGVQPKGFDHFALVYAGTLYPPKRILDPVLKAFKEFSSAQPSLHARFHYYGSHAEIVRRAAQELNIAQDVELHGDVSRGDALAAQKGANLVVVVATVQDETSLSDRGIVTGKIFDCLALARPALVVAPAKSDLRGVVDRTGGACCFAGSQVKEMAKFMSDVAKGWNPERRNASEYTWRSISRKLDTVLRSCLVA